MTKKCQMGRSRRSSKIDVVIGKGSREQNDLLAKHPNKLKGAIHNRTPELVFETGQSGSSPTDPAGAVGPNHYISVINTAFQIFDKSGKLSHWRVGISKPYNFSFQWMLCLTASYDNWMQTAGC